MMTTSDKYKTLETLSSGLYRERGSKFISLAVPISAIDQVQAVIDQAKKDHPKARHHCYAYRLGFDGLYFRANDDGEPSGTAGRPILGQIDAFGLTDVLIVVSRYFGGKLLGAAGLANAYKLSAVDALNSGQIVIKSLSAYFKAEFDYEIMGNLMQALANHQANLIEQQFEGKPFLIFSLPLSYDESKLDLIMANTMSMYPEEIAGKRSFSRLTITKLNWSPRGLS
jgi:uncharacterized YigZ family protein